MRFAGTRYPGRVRNVLDIFRRRQTRQRELREELSATGPEDPVDVAPDPNPDHAWKALALVNEWIRHADTKAAVTLAFTGVLATMTFNLVKDFQSRSALFDVLVVLACALIVITGALCGLTLLPRFTDKDQGDDANVEEVVVNRLFYASISSGFKGQRRQYSDVMHTLTADPVELTRDLSDQIHANAQIATVKNQWIRWAIRAALFTGATVSAIAIVIGVSNA